MEHIAIMKKSWRLIPKILSGEKTIETRWYKNKSAPWNKIKENDIVYFKDSGGPIVVRAEVEHVTQYEDLTKEKINEVRRKYQKEIGIKDEEVEGIDRFFEGKKYGILIFLKNPAEIEAFNINKQGFGIGAAWLSVDSIDQIKVK